MSKILVAGAGGFVGGYLVKALLERGHHVRAVSSRPVDKWLQKDSRAFNEGGLDLRYPDACDYAVSGVDQVYNLAAKVGGVGYITKQRLECALSTLINTHLLRSCQKFNVSRYFFSSSCCIYPSKEGVLTEADASLPNLAEGYALEKLFSERVCQYFQEETGVEVRVARFANCYGPGDDIKGAEGKHHAPSALCEKILWAKRNREGLKTIIINIWGDGTQLRNFLHVRDAAEGSIRLMESGAKVPVNLGSSEVFSINQIVSMLEEIAGVEVFRNYMLTAETGVHTRITDGSLFKQLVGGWEPEISMRIGLEETYRHIEKIL